MLIKAKRALRSPVTSIDANATLRRAHGKELVHQSQRCSDRGRGGTGRNHNRQSGTTKPQLKGCPASGLNPSDPKRTPAAVPSMSEVR